MAFTTQDILTAYKAAYGQEPDDLGEWLATTYAARFDDLKAMVGFIRICVDASGCSMAESLMRAIRIPGGGPSVLKIVKLAQEIVACDRRFEKMTETSFRDVRDLGTLQRVARQHKVLIDRRQQDVAYWQTKVAAEAGWDITGDADQQGQHEVEKVLDKRTTDEGLLEYQVKWAGVEERSWEPVENLAGVMTLVVEYEVALEKGTWQERSSGGSLPSDQMAGALSTIMDSQTQLAQALGRLEQSRNQEKTKAADEKEDTRMAWDRPVLEGDERRKKVGRDMFDKERGLRRMRKLSEMDAHKPFAAQYNAEMHKAMKVEGKLIEAEIQLSAATLAQDQQEATMAEARQSVLHDQLVVLEDRVQFIFECSQLAAQGKWVVAAKMLVEMEADAEDTTANSEFKKRKKAAEEALRKDAEVDRGVFIASQLPGGQGAMMGAVGHTGQWPQVLQQWGQQFGQPATGMLTPLPPMAGGPPVVPQGAGVPPVMPPAIQPRPPMGGQQGGGTGTQQGGRERLRTRFMPAETALGAKCPQALNGHMVPVGMRFFTPGKLLDSPQKQRNTPFPHKCKLCEKVGHEAFECTEAFEYNGRPACNYRQLFQMGLLDPHGMLK